MPEKSSQTRSAKKGRIFTTILTTAFKVWLKSQVSQVSQLEVEIRASDRQILTGCIPWVSVCASHAVYQGLHLTQVQLIAENIHINIGSVLKGHPLRLLETVSVSGQLIQSEEDFNASLSSELLSTALNDVLVTLVPEHCSKSKSISCQKIYFKKSKLILIAIPEQVSNFTEFNIHVEVELLSNHELQLIPIIRKDNTEDLIENSNNKHYIDLGSDVDIQELILTAGQLECRGKINVNP
jgi:hypothetical protein